MAARNAKYKSDALAAAHEAIADLYEIGAVSKETMRQFDDACLQPAIYAADTIRQLRDRAKLSQPVFARYLNVSESTVQKWESGAKKPTGAALRLLQVVDRHGVEVLT